MSVCNQKDLNTQLEHYYGGNHFHVGFTFVKFWWSVTKQNNTMKKHNCGIEFSILVISICWTIIVTTASFEKTIANNYVYKNNSIDKLKTCGATRNPEFPRTGPDRTETGPGSGNILKNIFGSGRVGEFYFGSVRVGAFLPGYETFSPGFSGINLPFIPILRK